MPNVRVTDLDRSLRYYEEVLGFRVAWRTTDETLAAVASGDIEMFLLTAWNDEAPPPIQSTYVYVEDPDSLCAEYQQSGATIVATVESRPSGMRDFTIADPDGHRFTLGCGEERLRDVASDYGMIADEIAVNPDWIKTRS